MIFNLFGGKSKLGVDIGTAAIKIVQMSKKGGRYTLENYGFLEFKGAGGTESGENILKLPDEDIVWGLKEVIKRSGFKSRDAVSAISAISTFTTIIEMPYLSEEDLAKAIPFEARKYVPIPLNEVVLDWSIVGIVEQPGRNVTTVSGKATPIVEVFLVAVPKDETSRYQRVMRDAGLNLVALELENSALIRGLLGNDLSPTAIVNVGGRSTSVIVVDKGYERISHNYEIGGFEITKAIARSLNINLEKAEALKRKLGLVESNENIIKESILSLVDMMIFETKKTITSYEDSKNIKISRVLLVGGLVNMPNFVNYFRSRLNREVFVGNVFSRVVYPPILTPIIQELSNTFSIAGGLAMREV